ncbi:hypothetical protein D3C87_1661410 [compost metagenome]
MFTTTLPLVGLEPFVKVNASPSASVAVTLPFTGVSSLVVLLSLLATGASFTGLTVTSITTVVSPPFPSLITISNESLPLKSVLGV